MCLNIQLIIYLAFFISQVGNEFRTFFVRFRKINAIYIELIPNSSHDLENSYQFLNVLRLRLLLTFLFLLALVCFIKCFYVFLSLLELSISLCLTAFEVIFRHKIYKVFFCHNLFSFLILEVLFTAFQQDLSSGGYF